jgi:hypothetical protein
MACQVVPLASTGLILPGKTPVTALASAPSAPGPTARATSSITSVLVERVSWNRLSASSAGWGPRTTRRPLGGAAGAALAGAFGSGAKAQGSGRVIAHSSVRGVFRGLPSARRSSSSSVMDQPLPKSAAEAPASCPAGSIRTKL